MTIRTRLAIAALASALAVAAGGAVFASAGADTLPAHHMISDQSNDGKWVGGASRDMEKGTWRATVTRGDEKVLLGHFEKKEDAEAAGKKEAKRRNADKVMDGPGCQPPLIVC